ncbi:selenocysteine-specific elongation factor [Clostridium homopropionicum DSM 5847]|uniref:Selenocysteine-specific elongation factor n=1 Tax=Clostridium homopropionicum DSM 5847 TaxID=1121318 RepID=A0A0L6ZB06_9CLOT|nr:selenocysteine-specific translation elongation factor [Clostridium homopropionicum]KOA20142.1 selenocysteine-specific elongation factor [Clostridium homopropionicum DSM 5847]SFG61507.1 selenocysteine-specific translation elongation factor SelB [Clostridium homopropionicum]
MKNVVMGTAGHIDHGKTALVKKLTGVDTDRLEEEKRRGMTIELGFAPLTLPSGKVISVIDVPGHEKFVKTMVAGVTGIDFVMLVIAADEGIMPQTKEHMEILSLLKIKNGVIALTKTDLVENKWLQMVKTDIKESIRGTWLKNYPIIPVSSITGEGIGELLSYLEKLAKDAEQYNAEELFRLHVDRVFTIAGHGTVITGTLMGGRVAKGDIIEILPEGINGKVRGLQVHNKNVEFATVGDRCAINITGVSKSEIERGNVIARPGDIKPSKLVDAVIFTTKDMEKLVHNQRVHVHIGTKEVLARLRILGANEIKNGAKGYIQLRFEESVVALRGDKFIIRSYSPAITIGGGEVIFHSTLNRQRFSEKNIEDLTIGELGNSEELIEYVLKSSKKLYSIQDLWQETLLSKSEIQKILAKLVETGKVIKLVEVNKYLSIDLYEQFIIEINQEFENLFKRNNFKFQIDKEEIKSKLFKQLDMKEFMNLLNSFIENNKFKLHNNQIVQMNGNIINRILQLKETKLVKEAIEKDGFNIRSLSVIKKSINVGKYKIEDILKFLIEIGEIVDLGSEMYIHKNSLKDAVNKIRYIFQGQDSASLVNIRDYLGVSRKVTLAVLEYLDNIGVTIREEDVRKPGIHFMDYYI